MSHRWSSPLVAGVLAALLGVSAPSVAAARGSDAAAPAHDAPAPAKKASKKAEPAAKTGAKHGKKEAKAAQASKTAKGARAVKKTASRGATSTKDKKAAKGGDSKAPTPCLGASVAFDGGLEGEAFALLDCKGAAREPARLALSRLARAAERTVATPEAGSAPASAKAAPPGAVDPGLLVRLDAIARRFPGRTISLVGGVRPESGGSLHETGRALDVRVAGVEVAELAAFCTSLPDTGCGYYPNGAFVHLDVRAARSGSVSWIDASGPGEPPLYVTEWPVREPAPGRAAPAELAQDGAGRED